MTAPCVNRNVQGETPQQRAEGQKLAREWFAAHPRDSPPSPFNRYFCSGLQKEEARTSLEKWRPKGSQLEPTPGLAESNGCPADRRYSTSLLVEPLSAD